MITGVVWVGFCFTTYLWCFYAVWRWNQRGAAAVAPVAAVYGGLPVAMYLSHFAALAVLPTYLLVFWLAMWPVGVLRRRVFREIQLRDEALRQIKDVRPPGSATERKTP